MSEQATSTGDPRVGLAEQRTEAAKFRTQIAMDRTTLAWIRTTVTMATFGFGNGVLQNRRGEESQCQKHPVAPGRNQVWSRTIMDLMGHSQMATSVRYTHATDHGKRRAVEALATYAQTIVTKNEKSRNRSGSQVLDCIGSGEWT
jgi:uncharacterized membrane protein YidH (DUF202 family)